MANQYEKKSLSNNPKFIEIVSSIYNTSVEIAAERVSSLVKEHNNSVNGQTFLFSSPGRIEVIGNHTDHNFGEVLAASVSVDLLAAVTPLPIPKVIVRSIGYPVVEVNIEDLGIKKEEIGDSAALVRGVANGFVERGLLIGGFVATTTSDVFKGAGMSSSAAFELLVSEIFNVFYNEGKIDPITKAIVSQYAENVYFGKPSGLMDQSAISFGGISHMDFRDPSSPQVEKVNWPFSDVSVVVVNCGGDHTNLTPNYASIRAEMEEVAGFFGKEKLREIEKRDFYDSIQDISKKTSGRAILRAIHFYEENSRVEKVYQALKNADEEEVFAGINQSGDSSYRLLQNCYPEGDKMQPIPLALALAQRIEGLRAVRVHGGGFAGTILAFVDNEKVETFKKYMGDIFGQGNIYLLKIRNSGATKIDI
ncbi:MAG: Galactokinase [Firmicutes bacterium ADurb.Bin080]|jgi:galactokinase|nr:galactokinase [Clostridiales bacterium]OQC13330.1 MAG: Galactokinase [Firmicutes bacterium ADurb.Bin080]